MTCLARSRHGHHFPVHATGWAPTSRERAYSGAASPPPEGVSAAVLPVFRHLPVPRRRIRPNTYRMSCRTPESKSLVYAAIRSTRPPDRYDENFPFYARAEKRSLKGSFRPRRVVGVGPRSTHAAPSAPSGARTASPAGRSSEAAAAMYLPAASSPSPTR